MDIALDKFSTIRGGATLRHEYYLSTFASTQILKVADMPTKLRLVSLDLHVMAPFLRNKQTSSTTASWKTPSSARQKPFSQHSVEKSNPCNTGLPTPLASSGAGGRPRAKSQEVRQRKRQRRLADRSQTRCRDPADNDVMVDAGNLGRAAVTPKWQASSHGRAPPPLHVLCIWVTEGQEKTPESRQASRESIPCRILTQSIDRLSDGRKGNSASLNLAIPCRGMLSRKCQPSQTLLLTCFHVADGETQNPGPSQARPSQAKPGQARHAPLDPMEIGE